MTKLQKTVLNGAGTALAVLSLAFVALKLQRHADEVRLHALSAALWMCLLVFSVLYGAANTCLALGWRDLVAQRDLRLNHGWSIRVYGLSQIAKYVPGNVFHFAGRQALGMAAGIPAWRLVKSAAWELAGIATACLGFGLLASSLYFPGVSTSMANLAFVIAMTSAYFAIRRALGRPFAAALCWQASFLIIAAGIFIVALRIAGANLPPTMWPPAVGAYLLAWAIGMATPGAPAGLGVREAVVYALLHESVTVAPLLTAVVLVRLVSVSGDLLFFLASFFYKDRASLRPAERS